MTQHSGRIARILNDSLQKSNKFEQSNPLDSHQPLPAQDKVR